MRKITVIIGIIFFFQISSISQIPNGSWRDHLAYTRGKSIAITPKKVYCGFSQSALLAYNRETGEIEKISPIQGLADINPSYLKYSDENEVLIIGYSSGNIDLITHEGVLNLPDITKKSMVASKTINKIECFGNLAYLACDFGIVVLDLTRNEVKDTYVFGPDGTSIKVNDVTIHNNSIYAATDLGLYRASLNASNLLDYSFWELENNGLESNVEFSLSESFGDYLFAVYKSQISGHDEIIYQDGSNWVNFNQQNDTSIFEIDEHNGLLSISGITKSIILNDQLSIVNNFDLNYGMHLLMDETGRTYFTSRNRGFGYFDNNEPKLIGVNGPRFNTTGLVFAKEDQVWVGSGGPFRLFTEGGGYNYFNNKWSSLNSGWNDGLEDVGNFYKIVYHPNDINRVFISAYGYGLYEINNLQFVQHFKWDEIDLFQSNIDQKVGVRIRGLDFDSNGKLWTVFDQTNQPVYSFNPDDNTWKNITFNSNVFKSSNLYSDLLVTQNNQIWILTRNSGVVVLKETSDGQFYEKSFPITDLDGNNMSYAYCLEEDNDGDVWIGTNRGPIIYNSTDNIFTEQDVRGYHIKIPRNDGTGQADFLLDYEIVNDIAVDGGNRKWIATESSGVFLISSDGKKTIHHFTKEKYPLFSNNILSIDVHEKTGEVFISTNLGLLSFMGSAITGNTDFENVYVYPNPIRPGYNGEITITGLIANSFVKITDVSGNLVYETKSLGGQAVWNGLDFDGKRVSTGVYLVFLSNEDGSKTYVTKLLFIH
jgi:ligand-binding sensor domain-containing protein